MIDLRCGDCRTVLAGMPAESVHMVCTSPPFWGLRRYSGAQEQVWGGQAGCLHEWGREIIRKDRGALHGINAQGGNTLAGVSGLETHQGQFCRECGAWHGAYGAEPSPELYLAHTLEVLRAIRRVLRADGTVWWNIDDSRAGSWGSMSHALNGKAKRQGTNERPPQSHKMDNHLKPTDLCLIPQRLLVALQEDGWHIHSDIIWAKDSTMPESVKGWRWERCRVKTKARAIGTSPQRVGAAEGLGAKPQRNAPGGEWQGGAEYEDCPGCPKCAPNDGYVLRRGSGRPTDSYEHILVLSKTDKYFWDSDGYREPLAASTFERAKYHWATPETKAAEYQSLNGLNRDEMYPINPAGRNVRSVWRMNPDGYAGGHFATFPSELPRRAILLGTSAKGCCPTCGAPWARVVENTGHQNKREPAHVPNNEPTKTDSTGWAPTSRATDNWRRTCAHPHGEEDSVPAVVLDPFMGTATTLAVALALGRSAIGIDISEEYLALARKRLEETTAGMRL